MTSFLATPRCPGLGHRLGDARLDRLRVERLVLGDRVGDQQAAGADFPLQADHAREIVQAVAAVIETCTPLERA